MFRDVRMTEHVAQIEVRECYTSVYSERLKESKHLRDLELDEMIALEFLSKNVTRNVGLNSVETRQVSGGWRH